MNKMDGKPHFQAKSPDTSVITAFVQALCCLGHDFPIPAGQDPEEALIMYLANDKVLLDHYRANYKLMFKHARPAYQVAELRDLAVNNLFGKPIASSLRFVSMRRFITFLDAGYVIVAWCQFPGSVSHHICITGYDRLENGNIRCFHVQDPMGNIAARYAGGSGGNQELSGEMLDRHLLPEYSFNKTIHLLR